MRTRPPFRRISVGAVHKLLTREDLIILDARDPRSYDRSRIGSATRISAENLQTAIDTTPKASPVLIYCYHGNASQVYAQVFANLGFREVYSLNGGFDAWVQAGESVFNMSIGAQNDVSQT